MAETQIKITADTKQAERAIAGLERAIKDLDGIASAAAKGLAAITAASAGMAYAINSAIQSVGDLADMADSLGMSAQNLGYLQQSAQLAGIGADQLNASLMRLQGNIGEALVNGSGAANDALERLNLSVDTLSRLPADQQLKKISSALNGIKDPAERSALSIDLLGKQGPRLLQAADNMARMEQEAKRLGLALSDLDVEAIRQAGDSVDELGFILNGAVKQAAAAVSPYIIAIVNNIKDAIEEAGGLDIVIREKIIPTIALAAKAAIIFASVWLSGAIVSSIAAIIRNLILMYNAIKVATTVMGVFNAVVGANPLIKIATIIMGLAGAFLAIKTVEPVFDNLDKQAKDILDNANKKLEENKNRVNEVADATARLNKEQEKVNKALENTILGLERNVKFEKDKIALGEANANAAKMIAEEERKLAEVKSKMTAKDRQRIIDAYAQLQATKELASFTKVLEGLETDRLSIAENDKNQREIVLAIRKQELEFNRKLTENEKTKLTTAIQAVQQARSQEAITKTLRGLETDRLILLETDKNQREIQTAILKTQEDIGRVLTEQEKTRLSTAIEAVQQARAQEIITKTLRSLDQERLTVTIADKDQREIQTSILRTQEDIGRSLSAEEKTRLTTAIQLTQQAREQGAIAESIFNYTRKQTELEKINRGISLQGTLDPMGGAGKEYARDEEALKAMLDRKLISEMEYYSQREELARQYNQKVQDLELKRIETVLQSQSSALAVEMSEKDRALLQAVGAQERQKAIVQERINFEKKSEVEKVSFALEQGATMFNALGAQNKKAFEAAKAFNMANAIMNTYMAVTKALATYPFPFSLIAAGGALAFGLAQVAQIRSQQYSGRALGGPVMGGQSYMVGESGPELFTPSTTGSITRNSDLEGGGVTNVNFTIVANDTTGFDQLLASRKGVIQQIISDAMLEKGRRSMV